jgi:tetratricopeptide (TPR) repeat protein
VAHISRHELKADQLRTTFEEFEEYVKTHYREIATVAGLVIVVAGLAGSLKFYQNRREAEANELLGTALKTFRAYVGAAPQGSVLPNFQSFPTARDKYKKAQEQFQEVVQKYSRVPAPKAVAVARYHVGLCQAFLGDHDAAVKTLQEAARESDRNIASLAQFALAGELVKAGKIDEAAKIYQEIVARPTSAVPEATAKLALADAYRATQPAKSRQIYQELEKKFDSDVAIAQVLKEQMASLPK